MKLFLCLAFAVISVGPLSAQVAAQSTTPVREGGPVMLRSGDIVRLRIWREPDLSGEFVIDEQGVVVFPKVGPIRVLGTSSDALRDTLVKSYQVFLRNPS